MKTYVARRLLALVPVALVVATVAFVLIHLAPGDPASIIAGPDANRDDVQRIERQLGLDAPFHMQLLRWYGRLLQGDLGDSIFLRKPVTEAIVDRVETTLLLTLFAIVVAIAWGAAGVLSARFHNSATDQALMVVALVACPFPLPARPVVSSCAFRVARLVSGGGLLAALEYGWLLTLRSLVLPALALGLVQSALIAASHARRCSMCCGAVHHGGTRQGPRGAGGHLQARAQKRHDPTVTIIGISFAILLSGAVVVETVFNIPGLAGHHLVPSAARLPGDPGRRPVRGGRVHADQSRRGPVLSRHRSAGEIPVSVIALPRPATAPRRVPRWLTVFARRKIAVAGAVLMAAVVAIALLAPVISRSPTHMDVAARLTAPGAAYWFGTDDVAAKSSAVHVTGRACRSVGVAVVSSRSRWARLRRRGRYYYRRSTTRDARDGRSHGLSRHRARHRAHGVAGAACYN